MIEPPRLRNCSDAVIARVPPRLPVEVRTAVTHAPDRDLFGNAAPLRPSKRNTAPVPTRRPHPAPAHDWGAVSELTVETSAPRFRRRRRRRRLRTLRALEGRAPSAIPGTTVAHPTPLVQSAAMAAVPHPAPSYRPTLPERIVTAGLLSDAQL